MALDVPLRRTTIRQKIISFLGPKVWSKRNNSLKAVKTTATFTHALKKQVLENLIGSYFLLIIIIFWSIIIINIIIYCLLLVLPLGGP